MAMTGPPPAGKVWVQTPFGPLAMTPAEAQRYQVMHPASMRTQDIGGGPTGPSQGPASPADNPIPPAGGGGDPRTPDTGGSPTGGGGLPIPPPTPPQGAVPPSLVPPIVGSTPFVTKLKNWLTGNANSLLPALGQITSAKLQSSGLEKAAEIEAAVQREALAYEKARDKNLWGLEQARYGDANARLSPYVSTGLSANARMAALLGLPAPETLPVTAVPWQESSAATASGPTVPPVMRATNPVIDQQTGQPIPQPSGPGSSTPGAGGGGYKGGPQGPGNKAQSTATDLTPQVPDAGTVLMRGPDGSLRQVPISQVAHYTAMGAVQV